VKTILTQHGLLKKLKFWRRRRDVGADFQKCIEERQTQLEKRDPKQEQLEACNIELEEKLAKQNIENEQVETTLHGRRGEIGRKRP